MVDWLFVDYAGARYSAHSRIRMMNDALARLASLRDQRDSGSISESTYTDAAAVNIVAYVDQLAHLPYEFWEPLRGGASVNRSYSDLLRDIELLVAVRNNIAHCYFRTAPNYNLIYTTANDDLPRVHEHVSRFFDEHDLSRNRSDYPTGPRASALYNVDHIGRVERYTGLITENLKPRRSRRARRPRDGSDERGGSRPGARSPRRAVGQSPLSYTGTACIAP